MLIPFTKGKTNTKENFRTYLAPEYSEEPHLKEAPPSGGDRENCTTVRSDLFLLIIACGVHTGGAWT